MQHSNPDWTNELVPTAFKRYMEILDEYLISKAKSLCDPYLLHRLKARELVIKEQDEEDSVIQQNRAERTISDNSLIGIKESHENNNDFIEAFNEFQINIDPAPNPYFEEEKVQSYGNLSCSSP